MQCKSLTLSAYLVLQQLSLFQTARAYFTKCIKTLNTFVETFSRQMFFFGLTSSVFWSCVSSTIRIFSRINNLTSNAYDITSKQVLVPKRGKKKHQHFLYPVNYLNQRKSPSAPLVSEEIETDFRSSSSFFFQKSRSSRSSRSCGP